MQIIKFNIVPSYNCLADVFTFQSLYDQRNEGCLIQDFLIKLGTIKCIICKSHLLSEGDYVTIIQHEIIEAISLILSGYDYKGSDNMNYIMYKLLPSIGFKSCCGLHYDVEDNI